MKLKRGVKRAVQPSIFDLHGVGSLFFPYPRTMGGGYIVDRLPESATDKLPLPPVHLRAGYGMKANGTADDSEFLRGGELQTNTLRQVLNEAGFHFAAGQRVMELGCATARLLRWFEEEARESEYWGCDIDAESIAWDRVHLGERFNFLINTTHPHLPFREGYFDVIFAGSVFTHITELADAWLLELRRVTRAGGWIYATFLDDVALETCRREFPKSEANQMTEAFDKQTGVLSRHYDLFTFMSDPRQSRIVYAREPLLNKLSRWFKVQRVVNRAYGWQTGILLKCPE